MSDRKRHGLVLLLVLGLLAASAVVIALKPTLLGLDLKGGVQLTYKAAPTPQTPVVTSSALADTISIMDSRVNSLGVSQADDRDPGQQSDRREPPGRARHQASRERGRVDRAAGVL